MPDFLQLDRNVFNALITFLGILGQATADDALQFGRCRRVEVFDGRRRLKNDQVQRLEN
jgi:hypothetical protein